MIYVPLGYKNKNLLNVDVVHGGSPYGKVIVFMCLYSKYLHYIYVQVLARLLVMAQDNRLNWSYSWPELKVTNLEKLLRNYHKNWANLHLPRWTLSLLSDIDHIKGAVLVVLVKYCFFSSFDSFACESNNNFYRKIC